MDGFLFPIKVKNMSNKNIFDDIIKSNLTNNIFIFGGK